MKGAAALLLGHLASFTTPTIKRFIVFNATVMFEILKSYVA